MIRAITVFCFPFILAPMTWAAVSPEAQIYFDSTIAGLIEAPKCFECHTSGGSAGYTRLVFLAAGANKNTFNATQFDNIINSFNAQYVLNKIKGVNHGGGEQYSQFSPGYQLFITFFELLEEDFGDDDGDGVGNTADLCPNTSENVIVDNTGCEIEEDLGTKWFVTPGASCRAADPSLSTKLQSRETGLTNTDNEILTIVCPIVLEVHNENSNISAGWKISLNAKNEGTVDFSLSCTANKYSGLKKLSAEEKTAELAADGSGGSSSASLSWTTNPSTDVSTHAISCELPPEGVIKSIATHLE